MVLSDEEIRLAWSAWEQPDIIRAYLGDWLEMSWDEKIAFFYGIVLPVMVGPRAWRDNLQHVRELQLVSRYPDRVAP
jgi:hypothetical protein